MGVDALWIVVGASVAGAVVAAAMAVLAWRRRTKPAIGSFGLLMAGAALWGCLAAIKMVVVDPQVAYGFERLVRMTSSLTPPLLLVFVVAYTGRAADLTRGRIALLFTVPVAYGLLSVTAPLHGLTSGPETARLVTEGAITAVVVPTDVPSSIEQAYSYLLIAGAYSLLLRFLLRSRAIYRRQSAIVAVGVAVPVLVDIASGLAVLSHPGLDVTPAAFGIAGLVLGWGLFRYDFLDVTPLASDILVAELPDPVFVLDDRGRILDHNHTAESVFEDATLSGQTVAAISQDLADAIADGTVYRRSSPEGEATYFDPRVTAIEDQHDRQRGRLVVLRNVTGQQRRQDRLEALQAATQQFILADSSERIAHLTITFADRVLDQDAAAMYVHEAAADMLRPVALSETLRAEYDSEDLVVEAATHPVFQTYRDREASVEDIPQTTLGEQFSHVLLVPIEGHGVLAIGTTAAGNFATEDEQFATILARTTQVALAQVEREQELRESRASTERRTEQMEFFNGVLQHTLRNALLVIEGRANHLKEQIDDARERHLDRIVQWCEDLSELSEEIEAINDTVSATEAERLDTIDLAPVIARRTDRLAAEFPDAVIETDLEDDCCVRANSLVEKVIDGIVSNAIIHNDADEPRVEVTVRTDDDTLILSVADNGPGMTDEMKETVFERNVTTSQTAHGFGLYFASVMMNLYGGSIWIEDHSSRDATTDVADSSDATNDSHADRTAQSDGGRSGAVAVLEFRRGNAQQSSQSHENDTA